MSEEKLNHMRHFYLYSKGHYKRNDLIEDLKKVQAEYTGCEAKYITPYDIISVLSGEAYKYIKKNEYLFTDFIRHLDPDNEKYFTQKTDDRPQYFRIIEGCLSVLHFRSVDEIEGSLGKADPKILPLSKNLKEKLKREKEEREKC